MTIRFKCDKCGTKIKAPDKATGRKAKCPNCMEKIVVPHLNLSSVNNASSLDQNFEHKNYQEDSCCNVKPCRYCGTYFNTSQLREKYDEIMSKRKKFQTLSFIFGIPGCILLILFPIFVTLEMVGFAIFAALVSPTLLFVGLGFYAEYKGQSFIWGLLGMCCVLLMLGLYDINEYKLNEIEEQLRAFGETVS